MTGPRKHHYSDDIPETPQVDTRDVIDEALAKQAAKRATREPAVIVSTIPTLPRQPKPARDRKRKRKF